jgi:hypothetical protein
MITTRPCPPTHPEQVASTRTSLNRTTSQNFVEALALRLDESTYAPNGTVAATYLTPDQSHIWKA